MNKTMVEVFKTNVQEARVSELLIRKLFEQSEAGRISFDLEDCDKVLRVEGESVFADDIIHIVTSLGYQCEVLA